MAADVCRRRQNRDSSERVEFRKISVARHEYVGAPVDGDLEELVVLRVARRLNRLYDLDDLDQRRQTEEERVAPVARDVRVELGGEQLLDQASRSSVSPFAALWAATSFRRSRNDRIFPDRSRS